MAHLIHRLSTRAAQPFLPINCAGLSEGLLESELFGYEKGAFTGAVQPKKGLFEAARGGTLFLDEIGEMLGALKPRLTDVLIVAATNRDLLAETAKGTFRRDLYYRLNGLTITIPPLRERRAEIDGLIASFLSEISRDSGSAIPELSAALGRACSSMTGRATSESSGT
jgi:transcriptional regulator with PAS, ATPase and Fis domain